MSHELDDNMSELRDILFALNKQGGKGTIYCKHLDLFLDKAGAYAFLKSYEADAKRERERRWGR